MKLTKILSLFVIGALMSSCGGDETESSEKTESGFKIKANEFSGTFNISKEDVENDMPYTSNGNDGWAIDFKDETTLYVSVEEEGYQVQFDDLFNSRAFTQYEVVEEGDNWAVLKGIKKGMGDKEDEIGYNFLLVTDGPKGKYLRFKCAGGENMFSDAPTEARARELMKIAQTFKMD